jgi:hypothetical protein
MTVPSASLSNSTWRRWLFAALCVAFLAAFPVAPAVAQSAPERVIARGGVHDDFARLVLDWPEQVVAAVKGNGQRLVLQFDRPAAIDLKAALADLQDYVVKARPSNGGSTLTLDFKAPITWRTFSDDSKLVLDFSFADDSSQQAFPNGPDPATGEIATEPASQTSSAARDSGAKAQVQPAPKPSVALPLVPVRAGEHKDFSRLAFDWPRNVDYDVDQSGDQVVLSFAAPARIDLSKPAKDLPSRLKSLAAVDAKAGAVVRLTMAPGSVLRDFRSGNTVVFDIYDRNASNVPPQQAGKASTPGAAEKNGLAEVAPAINMPEAQTASPQQQSPLPSVPPLQALQAQPAEPQAAPSANAALPDPQLQAALPEPQQSPAASSGGMTGPGVAAPVSSVAPTVFEPPKVAPPPVTVKITALPLRDSATLYFDWPKPVALSVFRHGDAVWLVFDAPGHGDLRPIAKLASVVGKPEILASPSAFVVRLTGGKAGSPSSASEGARWKVTLRPGTDMTPGQTVGQRRGTHPDGSTDLLIQAIASGAAVGLTDPADRSTLVVTPGQIAGLGVAKESDWPDFKLLPSYQGVVVAPLNDRVKIQALPNGVVITTPPSTGAAPAGATAQTAAAQQSGQPPESGTPQSAPAAANPPAPSIVDSAQPLGTVQGLFNAAKWRRGGEANFQNDLAALQDKLRSAAPNDHKQALLDLAEFYFANGYGPEASGRVDQLRGEDHGADNDPLIMALGAAARTMAGEDRRAEQFLAMPALQGVPEANLVRAVVAADKGDAASAAKFFAGPLPDISDYPPAFRNRIRLLAAQSLIDAGDPLTAQNYLDPVKQSNPDADSAARAAYLDGERLMKLGKKKEALDAWQALVDNPSDEIKAKSRFAVISAKLDDKSIDPKDAVAQIEALRYLWRGDTFEFDMLYKLGHLYLDTDQPRRGLITLRQAATHFPDHPMAKQAADDMTEAFRKLYLGGGGDKLSPLTAVALYDEFRELTPSGPDGDRMIAALADRLVKVDLLGSAADLLERQVKLRLSGVDKVKAGTRLAAIRLLDDKPDLALTALTESEDPAATPDLQTERRRLQARASFDTGDTLKGIGLVRDDSSLEGLWLKSDMYWELREWPSAADALGQLIVAEQVKLAAQAAIKGQSSVSDVTKNPASVLDKALAQANAAAAADAADTNGGAGAGDANPPADDAAASKAPAGSPMDAVLSRLVLNRAVALSLAGDRRGLKDIGRSFAPEMKTTPFAQPFQVLTSPDSGLTESIAAQMKSVDQLGTFVEEYRKILQAKSLSGSTEPNPDTGPLAPVDTTPPAAPSSGASAAPNPPTQTAAQPNAVPAAEQ